MKKELHRLLLFLLLAVILSSCAPVLSRSYLDEGERTVSFKALREDPSQYQGKLFILGGVIVRTRLTEEGSLIEALYVPVDGRGRLKAAGRSEGRFFALLPRSERMLDPLVYRQGRKVSLAAAFSGIRNGTIDDVEYRYPVFTIKQLYLWPGQVRYYGPPAYPYYYDPWFSPYPYFGEPWWGYRYYHTVPAGPPPGVRRPPPAQPQQQREPAPERTPEPER